MLHICQEKVLWFCNAPAYASISLGSSMDGFAGVYRGFGVFYGTYFVADSDAFGGK